ncbi:hypothetical protein [Bacteroides nordii]|jgi:hypothetical protein|uniref:hypothetical protein n=1 Tax=Bacteroides nordii TaxID=291645 RepID=UPI0018978CF8|nr:hypothetical protein [Bacteroides nordii]
MKRYNLSQIMKDAHSFFRSNSRMGRTFGECLKLAWRWAKDAIKFKEEREAKIKAMLANQKPVERTSYNDSKITWSDCYNSNSKGYMGSQYCGD